MLMERNATQFALLGLLTLCPEGASGYDLRQLAENSVGHFWRESFGQIYPVLKQLLKAGLVTARQQRGNGKRDRTIYKLTAQGRKELTSWLETAPREQPPRNEMLLKLFFGSETDPARLREHVDELLDRHQKLARRYQAIEQELKQKYAKHPGLPWWLTTLDFGRRHSDTILQWCEATLATIDRLHKKGKAHA